MKIQKRKTMGVFATQFNANIYPNGRALIGIYGVVPH